MPDAKSPYRLIVEGPDDQHSVIQLLKRHGFDWDDPARTRPYVHPAGGLEKALEAIPTAAKLYTRLGVVVDTDTDVDTDPQFPNRWAQVRGQTKLAGIALPDHPEPGGTIVRAPRGWFGIWLMPDNVSPGTLEHFLDTLIPADDPCRSHADEATTKARALQAPLPESDHLKGVLHAWLSWQDPPGRAYGTALTARILGHDSPIAQQFVAWFHRLFGDAPE